MEILVVTGLSGGGKSTVLDALEDLGAYCVDNIPVALLPELVAAVVTLDENRVLAVGIDARSRESLERYAAIHGDLVAKGHTIQVLFLEAQSPVLVRRYSETRRAHPMGDLPDAIDRERTLLAPLRRLADRPIDTSTLTGRQLRQLIRDHHGTRGLLQLVLTSFGFRHGLPNEADLVIDSRFLDNPHDQDALRPLSGLHDPVSKYVLGQPDAQALLEHVERLVRFTAPRSAREGRSYLTVAIGCTGGQHRSVALVEELKHRLLSGPALCDPPPRLVVRHRDIGGGR